MRIDVSEIKSFKNCKRQWRFSSRNAMHLRPVVNPKALAFGTLFHECLHKMYGGMDISDIYLYIENSDIEPLEKKMMFNMIEGYYINVYLMDTETLYILEIEHQFNFDFSEFVDLCGSIDMIVIETDKHIISGFEHKSTARFKEPVLLMMDEQPRVYTYALRKFVEKYNKDNDTDYGVGYIYFNEVRKLQKTFEHRRFPCNYTSLDFDKFMNHIHDVTVGIVFETELEVSEPEPSMMKCAMCSYSSICEHIGYADFTVEDIMQLLPDSFAVVKIDHLDVKAEQYND